MSDLIAFGNQYLREIIVSSIFVTLFSFSVFFIWLKSIECDYFIKKRKEKKTFFQALILHFFSLLFLLIGFTMFFIPGPGFLFVLLGLSVNPSRKIVSLRGHLLEKPETRSILNSLRKLLKKDRLVFQDSK